MLPPVPKREGEKKKKGGGGMKRRGEITQHSSGRSTPVFTSYNYFKTVTGN